jgi:hypothetical protein
LSRAFASQSSSASALKSGTTVDWLKLSQLITGYEQLHEFGLHPFSPDLNRTLFEFLCAKVKSDYSSSYEQESLTCAEAKRKLFNLVLSLNCGQILRQQTTRGTATDTTRDYLVELVDAHLFNSSDRKQASLFAYFKTELCTWLCRRHHTLIKYLFSKLAVSFGKTVGLLTTLMEFLIGDKSLRRDFGSSIVECLYENWPLFRENWQPDASIDNKLMLVNLLTKSMQIESVTAVRKSTTENVSIKNVAEMFSCLLADANTRLNFKCKLLDLLYFFTDAPAPYTLKSCLGQFLTQLPLRSKELVRGEDTYNDYVSAMRKMLVSLALSASNDLLSVLVTIVCREVDHVCDEEIRGGFVSFVKHLETSRQTSLVQLYWELWSKNEQNDERKYIMFRKVFAVFLENCERPIFIDFLCANIIFLMRILESELRDAANLEASCLNKKNVFEILQLAFKRLYKDEVIFAGAKLCVTYETSKFGTVKDGKALVKEILMKCRKHLFEGN